MDDGKQVYKNEIKNLQNSKIIKNLLIRDVPILVTECLAIQDPIVLLIQQKLQTIITESVSQLVINTIHDRTNILKEIINLVKYTRKLSIYYSAEYLEYCHSKEDNVTAKLVCIGLNFDCIPVICY